MTHTDINSQGWISRLPLSWQPFALLMRLDRPIGWWLLLLPGWWGIVLGSNGIQGMYSTDVQLMVLFFLGAIIMRGAGCIINDLWDRDLDAQVERTRLRPLASGQISPIKAILFLSYLLFCGFIILLMTSGIAILLGLVSMVFVIAYPLMKRWTWWPQAFLGLTFNFGALMGWAAATHDLRIEAVALYAAGFFWTLGYDTIYAHQDKADDVLIGIKSTARLFGDRSKFWVGLFYMLMMVMLCLALYLAQAGIVAAFLLIPVGLHLYSQLQAWDVDDPSSALAVFKANKITGLWVLLALSFTEILDQIREWGVPIPDLGLAAKQMMQTLFSNN